jgi:uncharacterized delta-60 repeat protein
MQKIFTFLSFFFFPNLMYAQDGTLDLTFGINGKVTTAVTLNDDLPRDMLVQPDNKIIVGGDVSVAIGDTAYMSLIRYNRNGTIDNTFGTNGKVTTGFADGICGIKAMALQTDGKIVTVGFFNKRINGISVNIDFAVVRYNSDGTLDTSFDGDGRVTTDFNSINDIAAAVTIQANGKIVVAGNSQQDGKMQPAMARYNVNGSLDASFNRTGKVLTLFPSDENYQIFTITVLGNGKIMLGKRALFDSGQYKLVATNMWRYTTDGQLDTSFGNNGRLGEVAELPINKVLRNNKILIVSQVFNPITGSSFKLLRYTSEGLTDPTFGTNGTVITPFTNPYVNVTDILEQKDGKIVIGGTFSGATTSAPYSFGLVRYLPNGLLDTTFGIYGKTILSPTLTGEGYIKLGIQDDGKIIYCGGYLDDMNKVNIVVTRFNNTLVRVKFINKNTPLSIYPNPTTNVLNIDFKEPILDVVKLTITDISGRMVYQKRYDKALINNNLQINIGDLAAGLYVVNIVSDKENISRIIAKQ